jgi:hypothetical protein
MLELKIDVKELTDQLENVTKELQLKVEKSIAALAGQTHAHIAEEARTKLHTRLKPYLDNLKEPEEVSDGIFVITLKEPGMWIEEGKPAGEMIDHFLKSSKAKPGANGKYLRIPFNHGDQTSKGISEKPRTPLQATLADTIKNELKSLKISNKIEMDASGKPKLGIVQKMNIKSLSPNDRKRLNLYSDRRISSGTLDKQSTSARSMLAGVIISQKEEKDEKGNVVKDKAGNSKIKRKIVTIRTVSESQKGKGMWNSPGIEGEKFMDEALDWATRQFEDKIKPEILKSID